MNASTAAGQAFTELSKNLMDSAGAAVKSVSGIATARYAAGIKAGRSVPGAIWNAAASSRHVKSALIGAGIGAGISGTYGGLTGQGFFASAARGAIPGAGIGAMSHFGKRVARYSTTRTAKSNLANIGYFKLQGEALNKAKLDARSIYTKARKNGQLKW